MTRKTLNVIIGIVFAFIVIFFAGSFAYENYLINKSDTEYEQNVDKDVDQASKDHQSGQTNDEAKN